MQANSFVSRHHWNMLRSAALVFGAAFWVQAWAAETTFEFEGTLRPGTVYADFFGAIGGSVSGEWQFDDAAAGSGGNPESYALESLNYITYLGIANHAGPGRIYVANDIDGNDAYTIGMLYGLGGDTPAGLTLTELSLQMIDSDGTVFSDTQLPSTPPDLTQFESAALFATYSDGVTTYRPIWDLTALTAAAPGGGGGGAPFPGRLFVAVLLVLVIWWMRRL